MRFEGWRFLKKVIFHKLNEHRWDRKGAIATLFFESFPNKEYHEAATVFAVRGLTALLNTAHSFPEVAEYDSEEINFCWIYWGLCYQEDRLEMVKNQWIPVRVDHKYWPEAEIVAFRRLLTVIAELNEAEIEDRNHPLAE